MTPRPEEHRRPAGNDPAEAAGAPRQPDDDRGPLGSPDVAGGPAGTGAGAADPSPPGAAEAEVEPEVDAAVQGEVEGEVDDAERTIEAELLDLVEAEAAEAEAVEVEAQAGAEAVGAEAEADSDLAVVTRERDEYLDALRRLQADFDNFRKRVQRQQQDVVARAAEQVVTALLPALDAFDLAESHLAGDESVSPGGLLQAAALLRDTLAKEGLERVAEAGDLFDPTAHQAVEHVEGDGKDGPLVDTVLRPGYRWKGRVVRPAMVKVRG